MIKKIATALQLAIAMLIVFAVYIPSQAQSEAIPSPTVEGMYRIESDYLKISEFKNKFVLYDILMIDIDAEKVQGTEEITADLYLPYVPENLNGIVLFDGWHAAHFSFVRLNEGCVKIKAKTADLVNFDGTVGLYLFVTGYKD